MSLIGGLAVQWPPMIGLLHVVVRRVLTSEGCGSEQSGSSSQVVEAKGRRVQPVPRPDHHEVLGQVVPRGVPQNQITVRQTIGVDKNEDVGVFYVFDTATHEVVHQGDTRGFDPHGVWPTPNGAEIWMVNRGTSNAIVIDADRLEIVDEIEFVGKTPDIVAMSPDGGRAYVTLRGPEPVSMPHMAVGETPGFAVIDIAARELVEVVQPDEGNAASDFHGIGVRVLD